MVFKPKLRYDAIYGTRREACARRAELEGRRQDEAAAMELGGIAQIHQKVLATADRIRKSPRGNIIKLVSMVMTLGIFFTLCFGDMYLVEEHEFYDEYLVSGSAAHRRLSARRLQATDNADNDDVSSICQGSGCQASSCRTREEYEDGLRAALFWVSGSKSFRTTMQCTSDYEKNCEYGKTDLQCVDTSCADICLVKKWTSLTVMYTFGMFYMFLALAIVCDEFFVPSLEVISDELNMSPDVAGATLMAAGGSMPELFTSFLATFRRSDVGFAAIVGSAVFNVLFVIGVCGMFSDEPLKLTWYPLFRDCMCYLVALGTIAVFFTVNYTGDPKDANQIESWEAAILMCIYLAYCCFMTVNGKVEKWIYSKTSKVSPVDVGNKEDEENTRFDQPSHFRKGIVALLKQNAPVGDTAGIAAVTEIKGNLEETFKSLDSDGDGFLTDEEIHKLVRGHGVNDSKLDESLQDISLRNAKGEISFEVFTKWYLASEARVAIEVKKVFDRFDTNSSGTIDRQEIETVLKHMGHKPTPENVSDAMNDIRKAHAESPEGSDTKEADQGDEVSFDQFYSWYHKTMFYQDQKHHQQVEADEEEAEAFSLAYPEGEDGGAPGTLALVWYVSTYPLAACMYCSMPDVRREGSKNLKTAMIEFGASLVWIAVFSTCLFEWLTIVSNSIGVPVNIAAITLLAGGTSVPDLLSSYVVAKQGHGDMAVSSSIGSNIFDVCIGLPLPWFLFSIINGEPVKVSSPGLGLDIIVLIGMLAAVGITIAAMKFTMEWKMGVVMMILYVLFLGQSIVRQSMEPPGVPCN